MKLLLPLLLALPLFSLTATADDNHVELLTNGACDGTFDGWEASTGEGYDWAIATEDDGTYSWILSSFDLCTLWQTIDLAEKNISADSIDNGEVWLKASAQMRSTNIEDGLGARVARVVVEMLDAEKKVLKTEVVIDDMRGFESWTTFSNIFQLAPGTRKLRYEVKACDVVVWNGHYGPRFRNLSLARTEPVVAPVDYVEMLTNGECDGTTNAWETSSGNGHNWAIAIEDDGTYSWVSSYDLCTLRQTIDLAEKNISTEAIDKGEVWLKASAQMRSSSTKGYGKGATIAMVAVYMLDADGNTIEASIVCGDESYFENWTTFTNMVFIAPGTRKLMYWVEGWDEVNWIGNYGPRFRNLSLAVDRMAIFSRADVNHDRKINTTDVVGIYTYIEQGDESGITRENADVNRDTQVNTTDVVAVYDFIINGDPDDKPTLPAGALPYPFSVSDTQTVLFANGNLQYVDGTWQFAAKQYYYFGTDQTTDHRDMFPYNGYTCPEGWHCLTNDEWTYLLSQRTVSNTLSSGALYTLATLGDKYKGMIVFPDDYTHPDGTGFTPGTYNTFSDYTATVSLEGWALMEKAGAMFLPCAGYKSRGETWKGVNVQGCYMTTTPTGGNYYDPWFGADFLSLTETSNQSTWSSVRLVTTK